MSKINKLWYSLVLAVAITAFKVLHMKIGGVATGASYSDPHTWQELIKFIPEFILFFVVFFTGIFIYESLGTKKSLICTNCENAFTSYAKKQDNITCPKCGSVAEDSKGFYERHPELISKQ